MSSFERINSNCYLQFMTLRRNRARSERESSIAVMRRFDLSR